MPAAFTSPGDRGHVAIDPSLDEVFERLRVNGSTIEQDLVDHIVRVRQAADRAWDMIGGPSDLEDAYHRGRAHAYCEVLGDQEKLASLGVFDRPHP